MEYHSWFWLEVRGCPVQKQIKALVLMIEILHGFVYQNTTWEARYLRATFNQFWSTLGYSGLFFLATWLSKQECWWYSTC